MPLAQLRTGGTTVAYADDEFRAVAGEESGAFLQTRRSNVGSGRIDLVSRGGGLLELSSSSSDYAIPPTMLCSGDGSAASGVLLRTGTGGTGSAAGDAQINGGRGGGAICMRSGNGFENGGQIELETGAGSEIGAPAALTTAGVSRDKSGDILVATKPQLQIRVQFESPQARQLHCQVTFELLLATQRAREVAMCGFLWLRARVRMVARRLCLEGEVPIGAGDTPLRRTG